jgi:hypothetical protein
MEKVIHKTKGLCTIWSEFTDYYVLMDANGRKFQAQAHDFTRPIDVNSTEVAPNLSFLEQCFKADIERSRIDINDLSLLTDDVVKALGLDEEVARVIVMNRPDRGYHDYPHLLDVLTVNNVSLDHKTIEHFKSKCLIVFGGVEEMY